jgi:crotonobetaine/carnitine-CoA ligase
VSEPFPETIIDLLERRAADAGAGGAPWLFFESDSWTLGDVLGEVDRIAVGLAERGVGPGDRVAISSGNRPEMLFVWFAANRLGAIFVPLNPAYKKDEVDAILRLVAPRVVVTDAAALARSGHNAPRVRISPDDVAVLLATSGTTGAPKAVMQTHRTYALTAEAFPSWIGLASTDRALLTLPLFHINAQAYGVMGALGAGASLALLPRFSARTFWHDAKRQGATQFNAVGAIVHILLKNEPSAHDRDHAVRLCYSALALPESEHRTFEERFGVAMTVGYGLSESTFGTVWPRGAPPRHGTMGQLRQHPRLGAINRARIVKDDGTDAKDGEPGELLLENPATMRGYWGDPTATERAMEGGWLRTGDLVRRDEDGWFTFVSRKKEVIRRRGENVAAAEIEGVLAAHPSVGEAAVVGIPSELGEEEIAAFVVPRVGADIDVEALLAWTRERLADFKVPSRIHVREALPRTATERVAKHLLK